MNQFLENNMNEDEKFKIQVKAWGLFIAVFLILAMLPLHIPLVVRFYIAAVLLIAWLVYYVNKGDKKS